ncbi:iron-sulfur cluster assembly protein [Saccharomonospora sp. NPDC006951]
MNVLAALGTVRDPELDEPITELGFVSEWSVDGGHVTVRLRLPTYFCAPNFAYLMVADAHDAVLALPWVTSADVRLEDHFAAEAINAGVAGETGFVGAFPEQAVEELTELRMTFKRKAYLASLDRLARKLDRAGKPLPDTLGELTDCAERTGLLRRRADLGLPCDDDAPLLLDEYGKPIPIAQSALKLRFARAVRVSVDGNAAFCRGLLSTRYPRSAQPADTYAGDRG